MHKTVTQDGSPENLKGNRHGGATPLAEVRAGIVACERCTRLREHCARVAREKRRSYRDEVYWGRPVSGFGDPTARLFILGLAPAAHGANRTGRLFTGDGIGGSGDFLMTALHRHGFASLPTSRRADDGLVLTDAYISAAVRCAPPDNMPTNAEIRNCLPHLAAEVAALPAIRLVVALGAVGYGAYLRLLRSQGTPIRPRPVFGHASINRLPNGVTLIGCYHPSRQNTNTGRLTPEMMADVFALARRTLAREASASAISPQ
ncbi:MAG: uracil-DNA glycosylase [Vicinamibacterales bacterium]